MYITQRLQAIGVIVTATISFLFFQRYNVFLRYMVGLRSFTSDDMSGITDMGSTSVPISEIKVPSKYSLFIRFAVFQTPTIDQLVLISGYDRIISLRLEVSSHETSFKPPLFIKVSALFQESKRSCIFVLRVSTLPLSTSHDVAIGLWNFSDCGIFCCSFCYFSEQPPIC